MIPTIMINGIKILKEMIVTLIEFELTYCKATWEFVGIGDGVGEGIGDGIEVGVGKGVGEGVGEGIGGGEGVGDGGSGGVGIVDWEHIWNELINKLQDRPDPDKLFTILIEEMQFAACNDPVIVTLFDVATFMTDKLYL